MNAFAEACLIEEQGFQDLLPFFRAYAYHGQIVKVAKGQLAKKLQEEVGDILLNSQKDQALISFELKIEQTNRYGNLFLETWSNKSRQTPGWMCNGLMATWLGYFFIQQQELYVVQLAHLRQWAFQTASKHRHGCRIEDFKEKQQKKREQLNDTWARVVPIAVLLDETPMQRCQIHRNQLSLGW